MIEKKSKIVHKDPWFLILLRIIVMLVGLGINILIFLYIIEVYGKGSSILPNILNLPHF